MVWLRPPGVYVEREEHRDFTIEVGRTGVPGFLGIATMGPVDIPTRVTSFQNFVDLFGERVPGGFLADAVKGFFDNGGQEAFIVRVAHARARGREETCRVARLEVPDARGLPTMRIEARSPGAWGNGIKVEVRPSPSRTRTFLTLDLEAGQSQATVKSARGFARGTVARIFDDAASEYVVVTEVSGKSISWNPAHGIGRTFKSAAPTYVEPVEFEIVASLHQKKEVFSGLSFSPLSAAYFERLVNGASRLIRVVNLESPSPLPECYPAEVQGAALTGGADGASTVTPEDFIGYNAGPGDRRGLGALAAVDAVDLVAAPDLMFAYRNSTGFRSLKDVEAVQEAMIAFCEETREAFALLDPPPGSDYERVMQWRLLFDSSYAALYYPWIIIEARGQRRPVPPCGHVAGSMARSDSRFGVHKPPANEVLEGALDLEVLLNDGDLAALNNAGINCIRCLPNRGIRVWGARTVSSDTSWRFINVRRIFTMLSRAIRQGTQWVVFEPNEPRLWNTVTLQVSEFLGRLHLKGFFRGESAEQAYFVHCNEVTNPPEVREAGQVIIEVGCAPVRPAEFLTLRICQYLEDQAAESEESASVPSG